MACGCGAGGMVCGGGACRNEGGSGGTWTGDGAGVFTGGAGVGACGDDSGCGKPKNKLGMSVGGGVTDCGRAAVFCRAKNSGAITFNGSSSSMPSWTDTAGGVGLINDRRLRQVKVMRPRFKAGSIR